VLSAVTCAPVTRTIRGIRSEVEVGLIEGLPETSVISCDNLLTIPQALLGLDAVGRLGPVKRAELDEAIRYALDIQH
jgi:mRNA interferase MazF